MERRGRPTPESPLPPSPYPKGSSSTWGRETGIGRSKRLLAGLAYQPPPSNPSPTPRATGGSGVREPPRVRRPARHLPTDPHRLSIGGEGGGSASGGPNGCWLDQPGLATPPPFSLSVKGIPHHSFAEPLSSLSVGQFFKVGGPPRGGSGVLRPPFPPSPQGPHRLSEAFLNDSRGEAIKTAGRTSQGLLPPPPPPTSLTRNGDFENP